MSPQIANVSIRIIGFGVAVYFFLFGIESVRGRLSPKWFATLNLVASLALFGSFIALIAYVP